MNSEMKNGGFECPVGFTKEDGIASQLYLEDLDEDSELWLIRMPSHVDPSVLENQEIDLNNQLETISCEGATYDCVTEKCEMPNLCVVLPRKESRRLTGVEKRFQGSVLLYGTVIEEENVQVKVEEMNEEPDDSFIKSKKHKHKSHKSTHSDSDISFRNEDSESGGTKKKSDKKKKSSVKMEPSSDADDFPNCISQQN